MGRFDDVPLPTEDNVPAPEWVVEGVVVHHDTFGRGVVRGVGLYKRRHTITVEFDDGLKALAPRYAMPHMRRAAPGAGLHGAPPPPEASRFGPWADVEP